MLADILSSIEKLDWQVRSAQKPEGKYIWMGLGRKTTMLKSLCRKGSYLGTNKKELRG